MNAAEIREVLGDGARCEFRYMSSGAPVLAVSADHSAGVVKVNGSLVPLAQRPGVGAAVPPRNALSLGAEPVRISLETEADGAWAAGEQRAAEMLFEIGSALRVGYVGFLSCN
jgi:hypothetical protein